MVVRIDNISKWAAIQPGEVLACPGTGARRVRVDLNCPAPTRVDVVQVDGEKVKVLAFLAVIEGYQPVEFTAEGDGVHLAFDSESEVWYFTNLGDAISTERPNVKSFAQLASRAARNPELELMMFKQQQNFNRLLARQQAQIDALAAAKADAEAQQPAPEPETVGAETGEVTGG